jgi:hypothetical protein
MTCSNMYQLVCQMNRLPILKVFYKLAKENCEESDLL